MAATPACPQCSVQYDLNRRLPNDNFFCKQCLLDVANNGTLEPPPLPQLPDDVLEEVFAWLPTRTLVGAARAVCCRWRHLAVRPHLWKWRELDGLTAEGRAALRIAHRLHQLSFLVRKDVGPYLDTYVTASGTRCAATRLHIAFHEDVDEDHDDPVLRGHLRRIVQRQVELGELRAVKLENVPGSFVLDLVLAALAAPGLTELYLDCGAVPENLLTAVAPPVSKMCPSLESLTFHGPVYYDERGDEYQPLLKFLLRALSGSLQSLLVLIPEITDCTAELIGTCSQLRRASIPSHNALVALEKCTLLADLLLTQMYYKDRVGLVPYFRRPPASRLRRLTFSDEDVDGVSSAVKELISALASSGHSLLEELHIEGLLDLTSYVEVMTALPSALPGLRHLHTLLLHDLPTATDLDRITPAVAPSLRWLGIPGMPEGGFSVWDLDASESDRCEQQCCLLAAWLDLVRRYAFLHVTGLPAKDVVCSLRGNAGCDCCGRGMNQDHYGTGDTEHISLYAHAEADPCTLSVHVEHTTRCPSESSCSCAHVWVCVN